MPYLQSYHIEVLALHALANSELNELPWQLFRFFEDAKGLLANSLWYDQGLADDYLSYADRLEALKRFDAAIGYARSGWFALHSDGSDHKGAIENWKKLFGDKFPAYG